MASKKGAKSSPEVKRPPGRPTIYTEELAAEICRRMSEGESLRSVCRDPGMPDKETVRTWKSGRPDFLAQYARAREDRAEVYADETVELADAIPPGASSEEVQRVRLQVESRKWAASKLDQKRYGNKLELDTGASLEDALRQIAEKKGLARGG